MSNWKKLESPPPGALKKITGGRLNGMTDINPQWRYKAMTEVYGECGVGWRWNLKRVWTEAGEAGEVFAFAEVEVQTAGEGETWYAPIPGIGGSMLVAKEKAGLRCNDEAFKMAVTDALSVALKFLGVGSLVYEGRMDSKYNGNGHDDDDDTIGPGQEGTLADLIDEVNADKSKFLGFFGIDVLSDLPVSQFSRAKAMLEKKRQVAQ